jgi:AraC family transcriptional regulator, transcriptional activator of pobA
MSERLPTLRLQAFCSPLPDAAQVYFPDYAAPRPKLPLHHPYRGDYYKISLCLRGRAELDINLKTHIVAPDSLVLATPDVIKQWLTVSEDYETLSVFFTKDFITSHNAATGRLRFLVQPSIHVLQLSASEAATVAASLRFLQQKYNTPHAQRGNILKSIINGLLYEIEPLFEPLAGGPAVASHSRRQQLAAGFRELVQAHCVSARSVQFYADQLCITPRHLNELVKAVTGRTASHWIGEAVALEAKALLQNPALPIQQVAARLHFADQFSFSRFFKNSTGLSPTAYRQAG